MKKLTALTTTIIIIAAAAIILAVSVAQSKPAVEVGQIWKLEYTSGDVKKLELVEVYEFDGKTVTYYTPGLKTIKDSAHMLSAVQSFIKHYQLVATGPIQVSPSAYGCNEAYQRGYYEGVERGVEFMKEIRDNPPTLKQ